MRSVPVVALVLLSSCRSQFDPENLHGVFERSAAPASEAAPSASAVSSASPKKGKKPISLAKPASSIAEETSPVVETRRKPIAGPCLARSGEPAVAHERPAKRPACRRAQILEDRDPDGTPRYACVFAPDAIEKRSPLPLVVFFHGRDESPAKVSKETQLRTLDEDFELSGDAAKKGFVVLAPQARRIGQHTSFDVGFVAPENGDVKATDRFVDVLASRGWIDRRRVYAIGAGQGGVMAAMWSMLHPDRVAAFASYGAVATELRSSCRDWTMPAAVAYRSCDAVTRCLDVEQWLGERDEAHAPTLALRLGSGNNIEPSCDLSLHSCRKEKGTANHHRWPSGRERDMLEFLARFRLELE